MPSKHLTIMFTDIKGFTSRSSQSTRNELLNLLEEHERLIRPVFGRFGGAVVKTIGDAFLVTFESPTDAVLCGMEVQGVLREHNKTVHPEEWLEVRVAINSGEVSVKDGDVYGEPVNIAARIEGIAQANEVYFTEAVYLAMNKKEVPSAEVGQRHLKGIPNEIRVYKVLQEPGVAPSPHVAPPPSLLKPRGAEGATYPPLAKLLIALGILFVLLLLLRDGSGFLLAVMLYVYTAYALSLLAKWAQTPRAWLAWVPIVQFFYPILIAKRSPWWILLYLIPGVNLIFLALTWKAIAEMKRKPWWVGVLILVPPVNLFVPGYLAFAKR